jgi:transposase-like protein
LWLGNLRANGHPNGSPWRPFQCTSCQGYFSEHHGTILHGQQVAVELIVLVLASLAEGVGIRATARAFEVDPNTVLHWLVEAVVGRRVNTLCQGEDGVQHQQEFMTF